MRLVHYSPKPLDKVIARRKQPAGFGRPYGLWISDDDGHPSWPQFIGMGGRSLGLMRHAYHITLASRAGILRLRSPTDIDRFGSRYGHRACNGRIHDIDWRRVAAEWDGILITPFVPERAGPRTVAAWYAGFDPPRDLVDQLGDHIGGWDCASGCIWRPRAIASVVQQYGRVGRSPGPVDGNPSIEWMRDTLLGATVHWS